MLKVNVDDVLKKIPNYEKALQAAARSINDSIRSAGTAASKETRKKFTITASRIKDGAVPKKATTSSLDSAMVFESSMVNMRNYKMSNKTPTYGQGKKLTGSVVKKGSTTYKGVFFARASKPVNDFVGPVKPNFIAFRRLKGKKGKNGKELIAPFYGPALKHIMSSDEVAKAFYDRAEEYYPERLEHHIMRAMK